MATKLSTDLSRTTGIAQLVLDELSDKSALCIAHAVYESLAEHNDLTEVDIGIGKLYIKLTDSAISYKFIPAKSLDNIIASTVTLKESPLVLTLESSLKDRLEKAYKGLF